MSERLAKLSGVKKKIKEHGKELAMFAVVGGLSVAAIALKSPDWSIQPQSLGDLLKNQGGEFMELGGAVLSAVVVPVKALAITGRFLQLAVLAGGVKNLRNLPVQA